MQDLHMLGSEMFMYLLHRVYPARLMSIKMTIVIIVLRTLKSMLAP